MLYWKNLHSWERLLRIIIGIIGLVFAYLSWGTSTPALIAGVAAASLALTGLLGFCPMCALVGRKIDKGA